MKDLSTGRDIGPRIGSPLWIYLAVVTAAGLCALLAAMRGLPASGVAGIAGGELFWVIAAVALIGEAKPVVLPARALPDSGAASLTFCFAALLYWGLPAAVLLRAAIALIFALAGRKPAFRAAADAAQFTLSLAAAAAVLAVAGLHPEPLRPWVLSGRDLGTVALAAAAFFACHFLLAGVARALHERAPLLATLRRALPSQAFTDLVLLSAAPLVVVVMNRSVLLVALFLLPLAAVYVNAAISMKREHQALHDELTGLPNRAQLLRRTGEALAGAARTGRTTGFLLLDLDRFKEVNDTLGHPIGDGLLRVVGHRLSRSVRPGDMVARLGGDEFAVLLPTVRSADAAREVATRLRAALAEPVRLEGVSVEVEASVGLALYPDDADSVEVLLQRADVAMYLAKERHSGVEHYVACSDRHSPARLSLLGDLRRGIDQGEFELHYQPTICLRDGHTAGMEALVRWRHPRRGLVGAAEFIPLAEQSFLMCELTSYVLHTALTQASAWRLSGLPVRLSVNVSARDLLDISLARMIEGELCSLGLPPDVLLLEISEQRLAGAGADIAAGMAALRAVGVGLSLDDFGTGYGSLARLKQMPVQEIKIDSSFVTTLADSRHSEMIVKSLVDLARGFGIRSVAKGVETVEVAAALQAMGCDAAQGQQLSPPLHPTAATAWLTSGGAARPPRLAAAVPARPVPAPTVPVPAVTALARPAPAGNPVTYPAAGIGDR